MSKFRLVPLGSAMIACAAWAFLSVTSFPIIVPADSDLGTSAMQRVGDATSMFGFSLAAAILAVRIIPWSGLRITLILVLFAFLAAHSFESDVTSPAARWPLMAVLGLTLVAEWAEARQRLPRPLHPLLFIGVAVSVPALAVLQDWQGRIYLGQIPTSKHPRPAEREGLRTSISLMDFDAHQAVAPQTRLRAIGERDGNLIVESLDGGPSFCVAASSPERMLQVLTFSPDGKVLAVADNNRMYAGSVITVWDVAPGSNNNPPTVVLRHTLRGHSHWTFSLDVFPDNRTLISANGDKTVRLWDLANGKEMASFVPHHHPNGYWDTHADCLVASPDGKSFVTWAVIDGIKVWDRQSLQLLRRMDTRGGIPCSLAFTADGDRLIAADREAVCTWELHPSPLPCLMLFAALIALAGWTCWQC